jgi:hypothetical protein
MADPAAPARKPRLTPNIVRRLAAEPGVYALTGRTVRSMPAEYHMQDGRTVTVMAQWIPPPWFLSLVPMFLADCQRAYKAGDGWRAWEAYHLAASCEPWGVPMPAWVTAYLRRVAKALGALSRDQDRLTGRRLEAAIARTLGLTALGRGTLKARRQRGEREAEIVAHLGQFITTGWKPYLAVEEVAKLYRVSKSTVNRIHEAALARGEPLDGRRQMAIPREQVPEVEPGDRITMATYPGGLPVVWIVESIATANADLTVAVLRPEIPTAH